MGAALDFARRGARLTGAIITTSLTAIIFATRASAKALARMHRYRARLNKLGTMGNCVAVKAALALAERDYQRAQAILAANPLPGKGFRSARPAAPVETETGRWLAAATPGVGR